jgi:hypothetical protein
MRRRGYKKVGDRKIRLFDHVKAGITDNLIWKVARDKIRTEGWHDAEVTRLELNARAACYGLARRDLRFALANKFGPLALDRDRLEALRIITPGGFLGLEDTSAIVGAVVYDRLLSELERKILDIVDRWKAAMKDLPFEPLIRWRESGPLRLSWAYVDRYHGAQGELQVRSHDIPGGVTDRWLRKHHPEGGAARRKEILPYAGELRAHAAAYSRLLVYVGRLKAKVHRSLRMDAPDGRVAV